MTDLLRKIRNRLFAGLARKEDLDRLYDQLAGLMQVRNAMEGRPVLKPMRGWAISPDAIAWILADIQERAAPVVIEFGSGQSTIILAAALRHRNGRLISVEHDADYCAVIRRQVVACGLEDLVEFVPAPLEEGPEGIRSYGTARLPDRGIDVALIDGPPYSNGPLTRLTPLRWAAAHLNPGGVIFLDDARRDWEQACLTQLGTNFPDLEATERAAEKGLAELRRK